jgi:energy-converting hydrogenase A subunit M
MNDVLKKIKELLKIESKKIIYIPFKVQSYSKVIELWNYYKKTNNININIIDFQKKMLYDIFSFHNNNENHVLLYYSKNLKNCLLMCKINNKYINMLAPIDPLKNLERNFVATYC